MIFNYEQTKDETDKYYWKRAILLFGIRNKLQKEIQEMGKRYNFKITTKDMQIDREVRRLSRSKNTDKADN